jgi:hypothetical protein
MFLEHYNISLPLHEFMENKRNVHAHARNGDRCFNMNVLLFEVV